MHCEPPHPTATLYEADDSFRCSDIIAARWPWRRPPRPCAAPRIALFWGVASGARLHCACSLACCSPGSLQERQEGKVVSILLQPQKSFQVCCHFKKFSHILNDLFCNISFGQNMTGTFLKWKLNKHWHFVLLVDLQCKCSLKTVEILCLSLIFKRLQPQNILFNDT